MALPLLCHHHSTSYFWYVYIYIHMYTNIFFGNLQEPEAYRDQIPVEQLHDPANAFWTSHPKYSSKNLFGEY